LLNPKNRTRTPTQLKKDTKVLKPPTTKPKEIFRGSCKENTFPLHLFGILEPL
jgi:hypothetical protein